MPCKPKPHGKPKPRPRPKGVRLSPDQIKFVVSRVLSSFELPVAMLFRRVPAHNADVLFIQVDTSSLKRAPATVDGAAVAITGREYARGLVTDDFIAEKIKNMLYPAKREIAHYMSSNNADAA